MTYVRRWVGSSATLAAVLGVAAACATTRDVERIVAETNAAMVSPFVDIAGASQGDWQQALAGIDDFIDAHPGNRALVAQLRLRQAMLLTANRKRNLADQYWDLVVPGDLQNERDKSLEAVGRQLSWWYWQAGERAEMQADAAAAADDAVTRLSETIPATEAGSDTRVFLSTIRAQIVVRQGRDSLLERPETALPVALNAYIESIGADSTWISDLDDLDVTAARQLKAFRYRIWLRELIGSYKRAATDLELDANDVDWKPDWVDRVR